MCDAWHPKSCVETLPYGSLPLEEMKSKLVYPPNLSIHLIRFYDVSQVYPELRGCLLSDKGISVDRGEFNFCEQCIDHLRNKRTKNPPKFAIANGNFIGSLPDDLKDLKPTEVAMVSLAGHITQVVNVQGGIGRKLIGHSTVFINKPGPPITLLPKKPLEASLQVVFAGGKQATQNQKDQILYKHFVRTEQVYAFASFLKTNNPLYSSVNIQQTLDQDGFDPTHILDDDVQFQNELFGSNHNHNITTEAENPDVELQEIQSSSLLTIQHSDSIVDIHTKNLFLMAFPDLFPFGRGGFEETRKIKISFLLWVRYLLRHSRFQFIQHPVFCLIAFDIQNRKNLLNTQCIKCSINPRLSEQIGSVSDQELKAFLEFEKQKYNARRIGMTIRELPNCLSGTFMRSVEKILQHGWFSDNERVYYRTRLFSMSNQLGAPHLFFTLSPDAPNRLLVKYYAGIISDQEYLTTITTPSSYQFNAPASAQYFDDQILFFIREFLKFDTKTQTSTGQGPFGTTKAYFGAVESQSTTNLHVHMLIWVQELPNSRASWEQSLQSQEFLDTLCQYADQVKSCSYPSENALHCPKCDANIEAIPLNDSLKKQDKSRIEPPHTLKCSDCGDTFPYNFFRSEYTKRHVIGTESLASSDSIGPLMQVQEHDFKHRKSCFKKSVRNDDPSECRFQMPMTPRLEPTQFIDGKLLHHRGLGCEYLNGYNPILARIFPGDNHDIQLLIGGTSTKEVSFYTMKYATKKQQKIENLQNFIYHEWIEKRKREIARSATSSLTTSQLGFGRLSSMIYQLSKYNEVPATVASLYLLRESGFYMSHSFATLSLFEAINFCKGFETQANIVLQPKTPEDDPSTNTNYAVIKILDDYINRPNVLNSVCWFQFVQEFLRVKKPAKLAESEDNLLFKTDHPLVETHMLEKSLTPSIVTLISRRIPKSTSSTPDDLEIFYLSCLLLFKPFTDIDTVQEWMQNLCVTYTSYIQEAPQWVKDYIDNNDDYWSQVEKRPIPERADPDHNSISNDYDEDDLDDFNEFDYIDQGEDIPESVLESSETCIQYHFRIANEISESLQNLPGLGKFL